MRSRPTRALTATAAVTLSLVLAGCGGEPKTATSGGVEGLEAVSVSGEVGEGVEVDWSDRMAADELESEVLVEGEGPVVEQGDSVLGYLWMANGFTQRTAYDGYERGAEVFTVGEDQAEYFRPIQGERVGSRVAVTVNASEAFGEAGNPDFGIGSGDPVLFVMDLVAPVADGPNGDPREAPAWAPTPEYDGDDRSTVTGLATRGIDAPGGELRVAPLIEGTGAEVQKGQTVAVRYLGRTAEKKKPFDETYQSDPVGIRLQQGSSIDGWVRGLTGQKVGSRVVLSIPSELGYGEQGSGEAIPPDSHLYFVVDILGAH